MLTADAFGVLPPIARLTPAGAMYHFLSGYTAKVAGTEKGVTEPKATFSTCFGAPFMVWHPNVYAKLLGERIAAHGATVWLVNTGWTGGPHGVGRRMPIADTRAMITAALSGALDEVAYTWADPTAYDLQAAKLAAMFAENFKTFEASASAEVRAAGPGEG
jgi:phosphoenolpyruvate carboxykinase (ATP)